ncbi:hypothetical protein [[Mycobacterium] vasticus]|uniref:ParB/Sulfiredoxin domain-containing protein n=1 Tax=[Mycobacterium] vasticus TaxID=2875777 RepID=A0ABU5Z3W6_9MYCO|nr:hypothetical protein [Mycolicibacter sp. MYC017]MEB3072082.1 hypothetical protein [Mycolicibacter sp. MYC017]
MTTGERAHSDEYGMRYDPNNVYVVERARSVSEAEWNKLPVELLPLGVTLQANEETLKRSSIDRVISGTEPIREDYVTKLWRDGSGDLHIVDGHHRVAMYYVLGKPLPVRIMDGAGAVRPPR